MPWSYYFSVYLLLGVSAAVETWPQFLCLIILCNCVCYVCCMEIVFDYLCEKDSWLTVGVKLLRRACDKSQLIDKMF